MGELRKFRSMLYGLAKLLGWITALSSLTKLASRIVNVSIGKVQTRQRGWLNGKLFD